MLSGPDGERFIQNLCTGSFFADYVFRNPEYFRGSKRKELCDALILFRDIAILIEVKTATELREKGASFEKITKWADKKRQQSIEQLVGAVRAIKTGKIQKVTNPRRGEVLLNAAQISTFYGIVILDHPFSGFQGPDISAFGAPSDVVMLCNFREFNMLCEELSTLGDFLHYLEFRKGIFGRVMFDSAGELDVLSCFKTRYDLCKQAMSEPQLTIVVEKSSWDRYETSRWRKELHHVNRHSYIVDRIVQDLHRSFTVREGQTAADAEANAAADPENSRAQYLHLLDEIAMLRRCERRDIGEKIFAKSELHVRTNRPRYFSYQSRSKPMVIVVCDDREERRMLLANLIHAIQVKREANECFGVAINSHRSETSSTDWCYSWHPWKNLADDPDLQEMATTFFKDAEYTHGDEWDATSIGKLRARARRSGSAVLAARPKRYKRRRKKKR